jgi:brefeldin A-inhibited guanine nucleotide-exchange protein
LSVIFTEIIIPIVEARSSITFHQRCSLLKSLQRILSDSSADGGRLLVEIYLNYDCDLEASARENIWETFMNALSKVMTSHYNSAEPTAAATAAANAAMNAPTPISQNLPPAITTATLTNFTKEQVKGLYSSSGDFVELKKRGLDLLVNGILKPLVEWCESKAPKSMVSRNADSIEAEVPSTPEREKEAGLGLVKDNDDITKKSNNALNMLREDDPTQFETLKHRKQMLMEGIKKFNFKPKKGMQFLLDSGLIAARTPLDIARFLLNNEGLNKNMVGEFLGEG